MRRGAVLECILGSMLEGRRSCGVFGRMVGGAWAPWLGESGWEGSGSTNVVIRWVGGLSRPGKIQLWRIMISEQRSSREILAQRDLKW